MKCLVLQKSSTHVKCAGESFMLKRNEKRIIVFQPSFPFYEFA